jgi:tetratricopeptide (TPR) repeat protein
LFVQDKIQSSKERPILELMSRLAQLEAMLAKSPDDSFLLFAVAKEYEKASDLEQALNFYTRLVEKDADYVGTYYHLAKLYEKIEQPERALDTYATGMEVARRVGDQHALAELSSAKLNLEMEDM